MKERVLHLRQEYRDLQRRLQDPAVFADPAEVARIGKRIAELEPLAELVAEYERCERAIADERSAGDDPELAELAREEARTARERMGDLEERMKQFLIPVDPLDARNVMLEVRAGTGGDEAALFAAELLRMYLRYAEEKGWATETIDLTEAAVGGIKEAIVRIAGASAYGHLKYEGGVHRVQRIPATENKGRVHTSAATVAVLPEVEERDLIIRPEDLRVDTFRAGGAGGQHVNKTDSAVRITHIPTGIVVSCQSERSQLKNKTRATELLRARLFAAREDERARSEESMRSGQVGTGDRSEKIRTYNFPQDRLTDHRIGENFHNLPGIMEGELDPIIDALRTADQARKLEVLTESE